jgi:hypothetical protein
MCHVERKLRHCTDLLLRAIQCIEHPMELGRDLARAASNYDRIQDLRYKRKKLYDYLRCQNREIG